jgi:hypothetical protein
MNNTGKTIRIVIRGTKQSQILDPDEIQEIVFEPGDAFREGINDVDELFSNMISTAHMRGDCIEGFYIGEDDLMTQFIVHSLMENAMNIEEAHAQLSDHPIFVNYESDDIYQKVIVQASLMKE